MSESSIRKIVRSEIISVLKIIPGLIPNDSSETELTPGQKAARTRKRRQAGRKAAATRAANRSA